MTYRADPISQRDGSALANSNCRMASIATGIDDQTGGGTTSTGAAMRSRQGDQSGGTDSGDAAEAWRSYSQTLRIMDGSSFDQALADLRAGRLIHLDVWHASVGGPCLSGSGAYGHTMAIAPESSGSRWLVADPWCSPPKWQWVEEARLRAGAEDWGAQIFRSTSGRRRLDPAERIALARRLAKRLMRRYHPGRPAPRGWPIRPRDTGGAQSIAYTTTTSTSGSSGGAEDMAIQAASGLETNYVCTLGPGRDFFRDPGLSDRLGEISPDGDPVACVYVGSPIGYDSRAVLIGTGTPYGDKQSRPTIVYVKGDACYSGGPQPVPPPEPGPEPEPPDLELALEQRDAEWEQALMGGQPWPSGAE